MTSPEFESLLTPAAREMLQQLVSDLRAQIVRGAAEVAVRNTGTVREISVSDLAQSFSRLQPDRFRPVSYPSLLERALRLYSVTGALVGFVAALFYLYVRFVAKGEAPFSPEAAIAVAGAGIALAVTSHYIREAYAVRRRHVIMYPKAAISIGVSAPDRPTQDLIGEFLLHWTDLEVSLHALASAFLGESAAKAPLSELLKELGGAHALPKQALLELTDLLQLRNRLVHGVGNVSGADVLEGIAAAERLRDRWFRPPQHVP